VLSKKQDTHTSEDLADLGRQPLGSSSFRSEGQAPTEAAPDHDENRR
jgi:hypothetical protein